MIVTAAQLRQAMLEKPVKEWRFERALRQIDDPKQVKKIQILWEYSTTFDSESPLVQMMAEKMGLSEQQVDELFELAATF